MYNPDIHKRKTIRISGFNYSSKNVYFITICAQNRNCIFGQIENGIFISNDVGKMIEQYWVQIEHEYQNIKLDEYIIMPNHLHGIISIVGAGLVSVQPNPPQTRADTRPAPTIGDILCAYKSKTTNCYIRNVNENNWVPFDKRLWQRNYFERIIRNENELNKIRCYIKRNPIKWVFGNDNPNRF